MQPPITLRLMALLNAKWNYDFYLKKTILRIPLRLVLIYWLCSICIQYQLPFHYQLDTFSNVIWKESSCTTPIVFSTTKKRLYFTFKIHIFSSLNPYKIHTQAFVESFNKRAWAQSRDSAKLHDIQKFAVDNQVFYHNPLDNLEKPNSQPFGMDPSQLLSQMVKTQILLNTLKLAPLSTEYTQNS